MPNTPEPTDFSDETIMQLGRAVVAYFAGLYPLAGLSRVDRLRGLIRHYGNQDKAGRAIGVSARTLRRWLTGRPILKRNQAKADRGYLAVHLKLHGFVPATRFERLTAAAWSAGQSIRELGELCNQLMTKDNKVPASLTLPKVPAFEPGMVRMWAPECSISDDDARGAFPFNTGLY